MGGGGVPKKKLRGMPERGKEDKMRGEGVVRKKFEGGGYSGEGKEDIMWGLRRKLRGRYAGEGKEDKMRGGVGVGGCGKNFEGGVCWRG